MRDRNWLQWQWQLAGFSENTIAAMLEIVDGDQKIKYCDSHTAHIAKQQRQTQTEDR